MIAEEMVNLGEKKSAIRENFEYGRQRMEQIGKEKVFDFSLGNPNVPAPAGVRRAMEKLLNQKDDVELFGYTPAQGIFETRKAIADNLNFRFGTSFRPDNFYITCGAASGIRIITQALTVPGDEYIIFTPYFLEYKVFVEAAGGKFVEVKTRQEDFQIDFSALEQAITEKTKAVLLNSPNSPSGVIISEENIIRLAALLNERSAFYRHTIYLIGDEPYRDLLYHALQTYGYTCICPEGAFYLFVQTLLPDSVAFCQYARKYELLIVPGDEFGCPGYARIAYCIPTCKIELADIEDIIRHNRNVVVVVDEAYIDFGGTSAFPLLEKYDNLLIVQTFSKSRALAGLRIGYAFGSPQLIRYLNAVKNSFNSYTMNRLVQVLGAAAVRDKEYFENTNTLIIATRERMKLLFVTHPLVKAKRLYEDLRSVGIYVRYFSKPERISNYLRIAIGTDQEADYLIMQLKKY